MMSAVTNVDSDLSELGLEDRVSERRLHVVSRLITKKRGEKEMLSSRKKTLSNYLVEITDARDVVFATDSDHVSSI